jgi:uncharacterized protein (TIGR02466 family)
MSTPKLIDATPFEPLVIKVHYDGFDFSKLEPICKNLIETTKINASLEIGDAFSSAANRFKNPHFIKEFSDFYKFLDPIAQHVIKNEWSLNSHFKYTISNSWVNVHGNGGFTKSHIHGPTALTTAAYLQLPENGGFIEFLDPLESIKAYHMKEYDEEQFNWKIVPAKTGDILIFPGWLRHRTQPNASDASRWVLTTNYVSSQNLIT